MQNTQNHSISKRILSSDATRNVHTNLWYNGSIHHILPLIPYPPKIMYIPSPKVHHQIPAHHELCAPRNYAKPRRVGVSKFTNHADVTFELEHLQLGWVCGRREQIVISRLPTALVRNVKRRRLRRTTLIRDRSLLSRAASFSSASFLIISHSIRGVQVNRGAFGRCCCRRRFPVL